MANQFIDNLIPCFYQAQAQARSKVVFRHGWTLPGPTYDKLLRSSRELRTFTTLWIPSNNQMILQPSPTLLEGEVRDLVIFCEVAVLESSGAVGEKCVCVDDKL